jgi:uncharacterized protein DUF929
MPKDPQPPRGKPGRPGPPATKSTGAAKSTPAKSTAAKSTAAKSTPAKSRSSSASRKYAERQAAREQAALAARRNRNRTIGIASILLVVVIVAALIIVKVGGGGGNSGASVSSPPAGTPIPAGITNKLTSVPLSTLAAAPTSGVSSPSAISDPKLTADGKPELLFIGAEFCPICATERWAMYVALSKFGTFSPQPGRIHSAVRDGDIPTITFYDTTYTSPYLTFTPVETTTNQPNGNYYVTLQSPTAAELKIWEAHTNQSFPFLDFAGKADLTTAQYDPSLLEGGLTFDQIASDVGNNSTTIGADIDASAKILIQTICSKMTGSKPASVCSAVGNG